MSNDTSIHAGRSGTYPLGSQNAARMGYGAMQLGRIVNTPAEALALLRRGVELGINHIDTAEFYGDGFANKIIREIIREAPQLVVATKIGADSDPGKKIPIRPAQRPEQLRASVEANLCSLGVEQLAVVNLRRLDVGPGLIAEGDQVVDLDDQLAVMIAMCKEGKIGAIGLSAVDAATLTRAIPAGIVCVQNAYSMISREHEDMLDLCVEYDIAWVPFFPLGGAFPQWPKVTQRPKVIEIASKIAGTPSQVGLAWLLAHKQNILLIPGTASLVHLEENIASAAIRFDKALLAELDDEYRPA